MAVSTIMRVKQIRHRQWKEAGYHRQARVENAFFRYKSLIGDRLRARSPMAQEAEALIACNILNRMTARQTCVLRDRRTRCVHGVVIKSRRNDRVVKVKRRLAVGAGANLHGTCARC